MGEIPAPGTGQSVPILPEQALIYGRSRHAASLPRFRHVMLLHRVRDEQFCITPFINIRLREPELRRIFMLQTLKKHRFLLEELVRRDFDRKYKGSFFGAAWSVLNPLMTLLIMRVVFGHFFGSTIEHYTTYLFCGTVVFSFFSESSTEGLMALMGNAHIFSKVNVPKYLFLLSKNTQTLINFAITLCVFFLFCAIDGIVFTWKFLALVYPIIMLLVFNLGVGFLLSAMYVFFRDMQYLWAILTQLLLYVSAVFYSIDTFPVHVQNAFLLNPIYLFIRYFRKVVIDSAIPSFGVHVLMAVDTLVVLLLGIWIYRKYDTEFLYYI